MNNQDQIEAIIGRIIAEGKHTDADLSQLRELFSASDSESLIQFGKNIVGKIYGQDIHTGDRIYQGADPEAIRQELRSVLQELRLVLQEKQKADAEAIREELRLFLEQLRLVLQKPIAERPQPEEQLLELVKEKIEERLEELPDKRINLDKEWKQDQVQHPEGVDLKKRYQGKIPEDLNIFDIFKKAKKQLLILGEPGSGKTTTMLVLAEALLDQAKKQSDAPIPVLLKLSSWKKEQLTMFAWLVKALMKEYRCGINQEDLGELLIKHKLLLMLDCLDELEENNRINCMKAINDLLKTGEYVAENKLWSPVRLVICSRSQEYETLKFQLELRRAICLQALSPAQIQEYLKDRQLQEVWQTIQDQEIVRNVLKRPLFLKIVCDAMQEIYIDKLKNFTSLEYRQPYLSIFFYIQSCLLHEKKDQQEKKDLEPKTTLRLLIWLAKQLQVHSKHEFFIEKMQPSWLPPGTRKWYVLLVALSIFLILLIPRIGFIYYTKRNLDISDSVLYIIVSGVIAVVASLPHKIKVFEKNLVNATFGNYPNLSWFWRRQENIPNQGILNSAINAVCIVGGIAIIFPVVLSIQLIQRPDLFISQFIYYLLRFILWIGLIVALFDGCLTTCIQHFILRLILHCKGHPWNYAEFLDNAVKLKLLRRVGGRYEFIHSPLKECFALLHDIEIAPNTEKTDCAS